MTLFKRFTVLRNDPEHAWLQDCDCPGTCVRYRLAYRADAYTRFFKDPRSEGPPRVKAKSGLNRALPASGRGPLERKRDRGICMAGGVPPGDPNAPCTR